MDEIRPPRASRKQKKKMSSSSSSSPDSENTGDTSSSSGPTTTTTARTAAREIRYAVVDDDGGGGDRIECSGKYCKSCSGALIADCVALCCCPCALINFFTLALVKVPLMIGRKCLRIRKKRENARKCGKIGSSFDRRRLSHPCVAAEMAEEEKMAAVEMLCGGGLGEEAEEEEVECVSARLEAERVWLELYQVGHLGFGRVSFTGIQSLGKGN